MCTPRRARGSRPGGVPGGAFQSDAKGKPSSKQLLGFRVQGLGFSVVGLRVRPGVGYWGGAV